MKLSARGLWLAMAVCSLVVWGCDGSSGLPSDGSVITCTDDEDCPVDQACEQGVCQPINPTCGDGGPCPDGEVCVDGQCVPETPDGGDGGDGSDGADDTPVPDIEVVSPLISGDTYQLDFGNVLVGISASQQIVLRNAGDANLRILQLNLEMGTDVEDFSVPQAIVDSLPMVIEPGGQAAIDIVYTASDGLTDHGILDIISNDPDEALVKIHLLSEFKGTAEAAVTPELLDFGDVPLGQASAPLTATLSNMGSGNAVLTVSDVRFGVLNNPDFGLSLRDMSGATVVPPVLLNNGDALDVQVIYHPQLRETDADEIVFVTDDPLQSMLEVALAGRGVVGDLAIAPSPVALGRVRVGEHGQTEVTISNAGGAELQVSGIALAAHSGEFSLASTEVDLAGLPANPLTLSPGQAVHVTLGFDPADAGDETTQLLVDNSSAEPQRAAAVSASGYVPPAVQADPDPPVLQYGNVQIDFGSGQAETSTLVVELTNVGGEPLRIDSIQRAASTSIEYTFSPASIPPIDMGVTVPLSVHFTPAALGAKQGALLVDTNDPDIAVDGVTGRLQIDMLANGIDPNIFVTPAASIAFGSVYVGQQVTRQVVVRNAGSGPLSVDAIALSPGSSNSYSLANLPQLPMVISNAMTELTFDVLYVPAAEGAQDAGAVLIDSSDIGNPRVDLALTGTGAACPVNTLDCNDDPQDGCEVTCVPAGAEQCNYRDDDCDCATDEDFDLDTDPDHCGSCANDCTYLHGLAGCSGGQCHLAQCAAGWDDCDDDEDTGCETDITTISDCGQCDRVCQFAHAEPSCLGGACVMGDCDTYFKDCDGLSNTGCEVSFNDDEQNCGDCNIRCLYANGTGICLGGFCRLDTCLQDFANCDTLENTGCEANLLTDPLNCNGCGNDCPDAGGTPVCNDGTCGVSDCNPGWADCNGDGTTCETNTAADPNNCGGCGNQCEFANDHGTFSCVGSTCVVSSCEAGWGNCDSQAPNGCETDVSQDAQNCGYCGHVCQLDHAGSYCAASACQLGACDAGFHNIDTNPLNGCECAEDSEADLCADALVTNLGSLGAGGNLELTITNNLIPWVAGVIQDEDWYTFTALDDFSADVAAGVDHHDLHVFFEAGSGNPGAQYAFKIYRFHGAGPNCSNKQLLCDANGALDFHHYGQNPCWRGTSNPNQSIRYCGDDDSARYWIQVYRVSSLVTCEPYVLRVILVP
ncbi:MAG TPA: choice-of-anchor D domain-containing protein [Myxococcota bacterium]|nr:choice-of-anchor D domain-containing protein [Myxococcota bacterium]HRY94082.1 choice-of-anchor D domain-containing protein [Myxococcota bacterium]